MPKLPRLTAEEAERMLLKSGFQHNKIWLKSYRGDNKAERMLLKSGFQHVRSKGSHKIYQRDKERFILPFHKGKTLHPKITKELFEVIDDVIG